MHTAYELQMPRICDAAEENVDLSKRKDALEAAPDNVLDGQ